MRKVAPWVGAALVLWYLFSQVPISEAWEAARGARLELFLPEMFAAVAIWFLVDSRAFAYLFSRFNAPLSWAEARSLRGVSYLLTPINWNVGTAAIVLHLRRSKNIGALDSSSSILFYGLMDGIVMGSFALVGVVLLPDSPEMARLREIAIFFVGFQLLNLVVFMAPLPNWGWLVRLRGFGIFRTHSLAELRDLSVLLLLRGVYFSCYVIMFWLGSHAFGVEVPLVLAAAATPAILMAGALPIAPAGIGTQAAAMLFFFGAHGDKPAIVAFGLAFPVVITATRCLLGLRYVGDLKVLRAAK